MEEKQVALYVVSDSLGDTAHRVAEAAAVQFSNAPQIEIKRFPFIDSEELLLTVLEDCVKEGAVLLTTISSPDLAEFCHRFVARHAVLHFDYLNPLVDVIASETGLVPRYEQGLMQTLNRHYFSRIEAMEFAVKYDDGKDPAGFAKADLVILGISRTSKTPLSIYLANKGYKVANLPIMPEIRVPEDIYKLPKGKLIGLVASPEYIRRIRSERVVMLGLSQTSNYNDLARIQAEILYFHELADLLKMPLIDIEGRSIEETAQVIEERFLDPEP